ncbi:EF-hand domain-containing protein, partial [Nostoc ellipsosporum NOK]|nr:EF-hand domain-containing protein [Nostoc ellipsosporum NOK]
MRQFRPPADKPSRQARPIPGLVQTSLERRNRMIKLKLAALLAAGAIAFGGGAALAAPAQQDQTAPKAQMARRPHHNPMDANKDGMISRDEWMKAAAARFERFDVNKDGKISRQELRFGRFEERMHRRHRRGWQHGGPHHG